MKAEDSAHSSDGSSLEVTGGEMKITVDGKTVTISEAEVVAAVKMWLVKERQKAGGKEK